MPQLDFCAWNSETVYLLIIFFVVYYVVIYRYVLLTVRVFKLRLKVKYCRLISLSILHLQRRICLRDLQIIIFGNFSVCLGLVGFLFHKQQVKVLKSFLYLQTTLLPDFASFVVTKEQVNLI